PGSALSGVAATATRGENGSPQAAARVRTSSVTRSGRLPPAHVREELGAALEASSLSRTTSRQQRSPRDDRVAQLRNRTKPSAHCYLQRERRARAHQR